MVLKFLVSQLMLVKISKTKKQNAMVGLLPMMTRFGMHQSQVHIAIVHVAFFLKITLGQSQKHNLFACFRIRVTIFWCSNQIMDGASNTKWKRNAHEDSPRVEKTYDSIFL